MKTQILLTVKDASLFTKGSSSLLWFLEVFKKAKMNVWIDSTDSAPITFEARKTPYELPLTPGKHVLYFEDTKRASRERIMRFSKALSYGALGAGFGLASGGLSGAAIGASAFGGGQRVKIQGNVLACVLADGDELAVTVQPKLRKVKIKIDS